MLERGIALVGMPGSGKTSVGKRLARLFDAEFIDTDALTEKNAGISVSEIFAREGEDGFRLRESEALKQAVSRNAVISCGGGIVVRLRNREILKTHVCVLYLAASVDTLAARVGDGRGRPLLAANARQKLTELMRAREPLYRSVANITVVTDGLKFDKAVETARQRIEEYFEIHGGNLK